jgi:predicted phosphate transport protein (TIGR00153 family)
MGVAHLSNLPVNTCFFSCTGLCREPFAPRRLQRGELDLARLFGLSFGTPFRFGSKREKRVLDLIAEHLEMVQRCARELKNMIDSVEQMNWALVKSQSEIVSKYESMADDLHREAVIQIAQGAFFAGMREDFLDLIEEMDDIADASQDAARAIAEAPIEHRILEYLQEGDPTIRHLVDCVDRCVTILVESVESLRTNAELAVDKSLEVEKAEEAADQIKSELIARISTHRKDMDALTYLQVKEMILKLDEVADAAENCSDFVITIVVKALS